MWYLVAITPSYTATTKVDKYILATVVRSL